MGGVYPKPEDRRPWTPRGLGLQFVRMHVATPHGPGDPCVLWPYSIGKGGYGMVHFGGSQIAAHRALLILRDGEPLDGQLAAHDLGHTGESGLRSCIIHARWATYTENSADSMADGTVARGADLPQTILTPADVLAIDEVIRAYGKRRGAVTDCAERYGVGLSTIQDIKAGRTWAHVTGRGS